jgi:succinate dehydrogenase / fumarate reductase membrane anchor subunit
MSTTETTASGIGPVEGGSVHTVDNPAPYIEAPRKRTGRTPRSTRGNF